MAGQVSLKSGHVSITGNFRDNNEDNCHIDPQARFFLVADGMGGQSAGEKASELAIDLISEKLQQWVDFQKSDAQATMDAIERAVTHANSEIMALGGLDSRYHNMGTTVTFIVNVANNLFIGGVGDSRVYRLRAGKLEQITKDHSLTQALVDAGTISAEEALTHRYKNVLYKYLGTKEGSGGSEPKQVVPAAGDRYMLCSDGVTDGASTVVIRDLLLASKDPLLTAQKIVEAAQQGGSRDNITCIVVHAD